MQPSRGLSSETGMRLGDAKAPLLLAVRPSVPAGVPSSVDAVLNIGLNDATAQGLAKAAGDPRFAYDSYRRLIQNYAHMVLGDDPAVFEDVLALFKEERGYVTDTEIKGSDARDSRWGSRHSLPATMTRPFRKIHASNCRPRFWRMMRTWTCAARPSQRKFMACRKMQGLAIIVQAMVFGNAGEDRVQAGPCHATDNQAWRG